MPARTPTACWVRAPAPGGRIVVEAAQLGAIARQFGVDWRPASSARSRGAGAARPAAAARGRAGCGARARSSRAGASADCDIELPGFTPPLVPVEATRGRSCRDLDYDAAAGRFSAVLSITGDGDGADPHAPRRPGGRHGRAAGRDHAAARRQRAACRGRPHGAGARHAGARRGGAAAGRRRRHAAEAPACRRPAARGQRTDAARDGAEGRQRD